MFERGSRYERVPDAVHVDQDGREIAYKLLRVVPMPPPDDAVEQRVVHEGDRLDLLAHELFDDPEQLWRIADANTAMRADRLVAEPGRRLRVPREERLL